MRWILYLVPLLCICLASEDEKTSAKLLLAKQILNKYLVESQDIVVRYFLYNAGNTAALDVHLTETGFQSVDFTVVAGQLRSKFDRIPAGTNVSHTIVVRPKKFGYFNFTAAEVTYMPTEDATEVQVGYSSEPGEGLIIPFAEFDRRFSAHTMDWLAFAFMTLPSLGIPFLLWYRSKSKYDAVIKKH